MVLASDAMKLDDSDQSLSQRNVEHLRLDEALICSQCVDRASISIKSNPTRFLLNQQTQFDEMFDYETGLISSETYVRNFGCWFGYVPFTSDESFTLGLSFYQLYCLGFRFHGLLLVNEVLLKQFLNNPRQLGHHVLNTQVTIEDSVRFRDHLSEHCCVDEATADRVAAIRPAIAASTAWSREQLRRG